MTRARRGLRWIRKFFVRSLVLLLLLVLVLAAPIVYVETACRPTGDRTSYDPIITDAGYRRREANSYLTYPEWHIVYAYDGMAEVLKESDEHRFGYLSSIRGFWSSYCQLNRAIGPHGGADRATRMTIDVIGASFTVEMALKALYEETIGRLFAVFRGGEKTPQDRYAAEMAADYAAFLRQIPWYRYDFDDATERLWNAPLDAPVRGWERRLALGAEWQAKAAYAQAIAGAVAATGQAQLVIRSVVSGLESTDLETIDDLSMIEVLPEGTVIETPRYRRFTEIVETIAGRGGEIVEIAGNDDIMVSLVAPPGTVVDGLTTSANEIGRIGRDGFDDERILVDVPVSDLAGLIRALGSSAARLEHVYDY